MIEDAFTLDALPDPAPPGEGASGANVGSAVANRGAADIEAHDGDDWPVNVVRTDPHRPGLIMPTDYQYVFSFGTMPSPGPGLPPMRFNVDRVLKMRDAGVMFGHRSVFQCDICGAHYNHGDVWYHVPTGEHITLGHDCADKYSMFTRRSEWREWHKQQTKLRSLAAKEKKFKMAAHKFLEERPELKAALELGRYWTDADFEHWPEDSEHGGGVKPLSKKDNQRRYRETTLADMRDKINRWGSISDATIAFALKLAAELKAAEEAPEPEEKHVPAPVGRVTVRGTVVSVREQESDFGVSWKMVVKVETPDGSWLVWCTVPTSILDVFHNDHTGGAHEGLYQWLRGKVVQFDAALTPGKDDYFAFGSRPTRGQVLVTEEGGGDIE